MNIFGVGLPEMILILAVALLVFGPKRLPEIGRTIAKTLKMLQDASKEFETELKKEADTLSSMVEDKPQPKSVSESAISTPNSPPESLSEGEPEPDGEVTTEPEPAAATSEGDSSTESASDEDDSPATDANGTEQQPQASQLEASTASAPEIGQESSVESEVA